MAAPRKCTLHNPIIRSSRTERANLCWWKSESQGSGEAGLGGGNNRGFRHALCLALSGVYTWTYICPKPLNWSLTTCAIYCPLIIPQQNVLMWIAWKDKGRNPFFSPCSRPAPNSCKMQSGFTYWEGLGRKLRWVFLKCDEHRDPLGRGPSGRFSRKDLHYGHLHYSSSLPFSPAGQPGDACFHAFIFFF